MTTTETVNLTCDMRESCTADVTMIDDNGFVYCTSHGMERRGWRPCRKLRPHELRRLQRGEQVTRY